MNEMLCRICFVKKRPCYNVYTWQTSDECPVYELINYVYDLNVTVNDGLPEYVCQDCLIIIEGIRRLKRKALNAKREFLLLREEKNASIKLEKDDSSDNTYPQVTDDGQLEEKQVLIHEEVRNSLKQEDNRANYYVIQDREVVLHREDETPQASRWVKDDKIAAINYLEYHDSERTNLKEEPTDEELKRTAGDGELVASAEEELEHPFYGFEEDIEAESMEQPTHAVDVARVQIHREMQTKIFKCDFCGRIFKRRKNLENHAKSHPNKTLFKCKLCQYSTQYSSKMKSHVCETGTKSSNPLAREGQIQRHSALKAYECNFCEYSTSNKNHLNIHLRKHTGEKPFKCECCDFRTSYKTVLKAHILRHSGDKPHKCKMCEYSTSDKSNFFVHLRTHSDKRPFKCKHCDFGFKSKPDYVIHLRKHTGDKPYKCDQCNFVTSYRSVLYHHAVRHNKDKHYKCKLCDYSSPDKSNFHVHLRKHSRKTPYHCNLCEFKTSYSSSFKAHKRMHASEKPFKCNLCGYRSSYHSGLSYHMTVHSSEKPFKCDHCYYASSNKINLKRHLGKMHRDEKPS